MLKLACYVIFIGDLLTNRQLDVLDLYYNQNLSLSEVSENLGVTRQAVKDCIVKGEKRLFDLEEKLEIMKKSQKQEKQIQKILSELSEIQTKYTDEEIAEIINNVMQELRCLA